MIKLFRKLRQNLINSTSERDGLVRAGSKTTKYLKYALGEIILVVIGILIALSINNWNTKRIQNNDAQELLKRLSIETNQNIQTVQTQIDVLNGNLNASLKFLKMTGADYLEQDIQETDSLIYIIISTPRFELNSSVINEAITTGKLANIKSDSLRNLIYELPSILTNIKDNISYIDSHDESFLFHRLYDLISLRQIDVKFSPDKLKLGKSAFPQIDTRLILNDLKFESIIDNKYFLMNTLLSSYYVTKMKLGKLSQTISNDIENN